MGVVDDKLVRTGLKRRTTSRRFILEPFPPTARVRNMSTIVFNRLENAMKFAGLGA
jgi:hypothetical protein